MLFICFYFLLSFHVEKEWTVLRFSPPASREPSRRFFGVVSICWHPTAVPPPSSDPPLPTVQADAPPHGRAIDQLHHGRRVPAAGVRRREPPHLCVFFLPLDPVADLFEGNIFKAGEGTHCGALKNIAFLSILPTFGFLHSAVTHMSQTFHFILFVFFLHFLRLFLKKKEQ